MMKLLILFLYTLSIVTSVHSQSIKSLKIVPETTFLLALEGDALKLECIVEFTGEANVDTMFSKDGMMIPVGNDYGYEVIVTDQSVNSSMDIFISTTTLRKNVTYSSDKGVYKCDAEREADKKTTSITVYTFTATGGDAKLPVVAEGKEAETIELRCDIDVKTSNDLVVNDYKVAWERDGKMIDKTADKFNIVKNTLQILKPTRADMGEYQCVVTFFATSPVERQTVRPKPSYLKAGPAIDSHDNNKNMVQGDNMELKCKISGFPKPTVSWFKDGASIKTTTRIHILEYEGAMGKLKINSLKDGDEGYYKCVAENDVAPFNATAEMRVRVQEKVDLVPSSGPVLELEPLIPFTIITYFLISFMEH